MADYLTLANIYAAINRATKKFKGSQDVLVTEMANMAYFAMLSADDLYPIFWLRDLDDTLRTLAPMTITAITKANPVSITAATIAFVDSNPDTITDSGNAFVTGGFVVGAITVSGSTSNDGTYTVETVAAGTLTLAAGDTLTAEGASATVTITMHPAVVSAANTLTEEDIVSIYNVVGMTEVNNRVFKVGSAAQGLTTSAVPLLDLDGTAINSSAFTAYSSAGNLVHRGLTLATTGRNVEKILSCSFHGYNGSLAEITPKELEESTKWWDDNTSRPKRYLHRKAYTSAGVETNQLLWFPGSDAAYDLRYWIEKRVSPLAADGDVPLMPPRFHYGIVAGGITKLIEMKVEVENAVIWPSIYKAITLEMITFNRKFYQDNDAIDRERPFLL